MKYTSHAMSRFVALKYRDYRLLWIGSLISWTGSEMSTIALTWMLYQMTGSALALSETLLTPTSCVVGVP